MSGKLSSLKVLLVSDLEKSKQYYREVLGFDVTDWWAERGGLQGVALKLHQAAFPDEVVPNPTPANGGYAVDVQVYTETWIQLDSLYNEFRSKGAVIAVEPVVYQDGGPWKEFVVQDLDGYNFAFGGVDGARTVSPIDASDSTIILWVRDIEKAANLYSRLLGLEMRDKERFGHLHVFRLHNGSSLMLDSNGMEHIPVPERGPVLCKFSTHDIDTAYEHAINLGFQLTYGIERYPMVSFFNIRDQDGNIICISQDHK